MDTVAKLSAYAKTTDYKIRVVGIPKTIDNAVAGTDHTPGYGSAAKYIAVYMQEILRDCSVYTVKAVTIVEICLLYTSILQKWLKSGLVFRPAQLPNMNLPVLTRLDSALESISSDRIKPSMQLFKINVCHILTNFICCKENNFHFSSKTSSMAIK